MNGRHLPHLIVEGFFNTEKYASSPRLGPEFALPARDRTAHGTSVREQLQKVRGENEQNRGVQTEPDELAPISLEVRSEPGFVLKLDSLDNRQQGIQVPEGALMQFFKFVEKYLAEDTKGTEKTPPKPRHQDLIDCIAGVRLATLQSFWTDDKDFPQADTPIWWEVWVRVAGDQSPWDLFASLARANGLTPGSDTIRFPDRLVGLVRGTAHQLMESTVLLEMIGEVRRAKENPADFIALEPKDQAVLVDDLVSRITAPPLTAPAICLLDCGVVANPLVQPALAPADCYRYDPNWALADDPNNPAVESHGSEMAGLLLFGSDLAELLSSKDSVQLAHRLESVRILPPKPLRNERRLYGAITSQAISRVEIDAPIRNRSFCMAITTDGKDRGRPSSWSGAIDQICAGITDENPRLFFVAAGNSDINQRHLYPDSNDTDNVQDPAQAWNAITVGASTDRVWFDPKKFSGYVPIASQAGDLSPSSTTSLAWERSWPYKPDIVLEGGNQIVVPGTDSVRDPDDMAILTTAHATSGRLLVNFRDTSAATAQAARMAAILQAEYPNFWPEAVRALLIHSAEWTKPMNEAFGKNKIDAVNRLRRYGYGIPSLNRARYSARDSLTLIAQQRIQPFRKKVTTNEYGHEVTGSEIETYQMGLHSLPWPKDQLSDLGDQQVIMRVTLSYFIEPKPGRREGFVKYRHRYQSHGLRFEVKRPQETLDDLRKRVSNAARGEEEAFEAVGDTSGWALGPQARTRGSIHSHWWSGTASDLANCGFVIVYPVSGWWRESKGNHWSKEARYALIVSIRTTKQRVSLFTPTEIDFYTPVDLAIKATVKQPISTEVILEDGLIEEE